MKIKIPDLKDKLIVSLTARGLTDDEANTVAEPFLEAELQGKKTHGISKFLLIDEAIQKREGKPEIVKDKHNYALIDAHRELGYISAQFAVDTLIGKVKEYDNATVAVVNSYYYSMAGIYAKKIAKAGFVGVVLNNGGPAAVTPFGGVDPIFGTNPIAVGIPTDGEPIVLDMATSEKTWGEINLAKVEGRKLQDKTFFDKDGNFTTDPYKAESIVPFGGAKGYGLNFIFEILTGAFVGAKMGLQSKDGYDLGFFFMAFSPTMFTTKEEFDDKVAQLVKEIKQSRKENGVLEIYLPSEQSSKRMEKALEFGEIELGEDVWEKLLAFSKGEDVKGKVGMKE